jgi:hypothetical protein
VEFSWTPMANAVGLPAANLEKSLFSSTLVDKRVAQPMLRLQAWAKERTTGWYSRTKRQGKESVESEKNRFTIIPKGKQTEAIDWTWIRSFSMGT